MEKNSEMLNENKYEAVCTAWPYSSKKYGVSIRFLFIGMMLRLPILSLKKTLQNIQLENKS